MQLIPVIDLLRGQVVRGVGGRRDEYRPLVSALTKSTDPDDVARALIDNFHPEVIYLADLDAITRNMTQDHAWETIAKKGVNLLIDAGVRNVQQADKYLGRIRRQIGLSSRLVIGSETFESIGQLQTLAGNYVFSLDLKQGKPIVRDPEWQQATPGEIAERIAAIGIPTLIVLDLADVGSGKGPSTLPIIRALNAKYPELEIIAGGGVRDGADLQELQRGGASGALVASALHDRRVTAADVPV